MASSSRTAERRYGASSRQSSAPRVQRRAYLRSTPCRPCAPFCRELAVERAACVSIMGAARFVSCRVERFEQSAGVLDGACDVGEPDVLVRRMHPTATVYRVVGSGQAGYADMIAKGREQG